ncbi:cell wall-active antibiotics response protein LiaF [Vagococcus xieshaowenii]|uniref:Cell wall-active antibiotics response LiaF-like C-terminal domain-containing protein n=1 Tax=Vagococcus xieshaowenii TaxID=2562451 RepID=A0AAJ5EGX1_9ENTE|nr:cell wall-active antibiotics response protein LiaF [Vagococcus xieshaowenii]QCA28365.1 hypothetical protein E4Z98_03200 [Vagococcus xieshaowenii]TFZ42878.1 hypothetical protein E4031_02540 [Vagococcus xieshaowenii]
MKHSWRVFIVIELLMLLFVLYKVVNETQALIFLIFGIVNIIFAIKRKRKSSFSQFQLIMGVVISLMSLLTSGPVIWFMLVFAILFFGLVGVETSGLSVLEHLDLVPWKDKQMINVETVEPAVKNGKKFKRQLFGNQRIGSSVFEWDDINLLIISGDTIIDLGNTILPKEDNVVLIRKGFGRTRIIVPMGIGIMVEHTTLSGKLVFEEKSFNLKNEAIKIFSDDYDGNVRRIKLVTNTLLGDVEVVRI